MKVHELARRAELPPHIVRYYTRIGLLRPRRDPDNGYKLYSESDTRRLRFIRQAQELGFTLTEIGEILDHAAHDRSPCPRVREIIERRIVDNRRKLAELLALQGRMEDALRQWRTMPDGEPDGETVCILIESITGPREH